MKNTTTKQIEAAAKFLREHDKLEVIKDGTLAHDIAVGALQAALYAGQPNVNSVALSDAEIDKHLDAVLKASGSALRNYSMPKTLGDMRKAMRVAISFKEASSHE